MQVKITMKYYLIPVRMAIIKKKKTTTKVDEDVEKREPSHAVGGNVNLFSHFRKQNRGFSKYYK